MQNKVPQQRFGNYCVIARMDGHSEIMRIEDGKNIFDSAKEVIGCRYLDHVQVYQIAPDVIIEFLVNDEGYPQWGNDPGKVNPMGTFIYNKNLDSPHYILGDIVFCLSVSGNDGWEFTGMSEALATRIAIINNAQFLQEVKDLIKRPATLPVPEVKISSYESTEDLLKAMKGDKTVKPISETILPGNVSP